MNIVTNDKNGIVSFSNSDFDSCLFSQKCGNQPSLADNRRVTAGIGETDCDGQPLAQYQAAKTAFLAS